MTSTAAGSPARLRDDDVRVQGYDTTKYYYLNGQRIAMRRCAGTTCEAPIYLHGDHLGSASLATDAAGRVVSEMRYTPYGETRSGAQPTDRRFTGQRYEAGTGLYDYNARTYDPYINRWIQPDTIIPGPSPQALNRYSYVYNNPYRST
jgi:RHS repeat-associated protein